MWDDSCTWTCLNHFRNAQEIVWPEDMASQGFIRTGQEKGKEQERDEHGGMGSFKRKKKKNKGIHSQIKLNVLPVLSLGDISRE